MYTYLYADEMLDTPTDQIKIVSIGSTLGTSDTMKANSSLLQWAIRLSGLQGPVKMQTMDYMTEYIMRQKKHVFHKFYLNVTREEDQRIFRLNKRLPTLKNLTGEMIKDKVNEIKLQNVLTELVTDKFGWENSCDAKAVCDQDVTGGECATVGIDCGYGMICAQVGADGEEKLQCTGTKESTGKWCSEHPKE
jgi:hypothetical protein